MARNAVTKVTIRKEGGFTKESVQQVYDQISDIIDRGSAERLKDDFVAAAGVAIEALHAGSPYDPNRSSKKKGTHLVEAEFLSDPRPDKPYVLIGVNFGKAPQGYMLEYGTSKAPAHPWWRRIVLSVKSSVAQIILDGFKREIGAK